METKFNNYKEINSQIAETVQAISNIKEWPNKSAADMRELDAEKKKLSALTLKKLECLREISIAAQAEELFLTQNIVCNATTVQPHA